MSAGPQPIADRRAVLRTAGGFLATMLAPGITLYAFGGRGEPAGGQASASVRWALLIDISKCLPGCDLCVSACREENGWNGNERSEIGPQWIRKIKLQDERTGAHREVPVMCQHCDKPACVDVCPTGASFKRADGIVLVDKHICIGCRFCMMACPYKARSFVHQPLTDQKPWAPRGKGTVEGCTLCVHRLDSARLPACVEACAARGGAAMIFGDLNDPSSEIAKAVASHASSQIRSDLGLGPAVRYQNL